MKPAKVDVNFYIRSTTPLVEHEEYPEGVPSWASDLPPRDVYKVMHSRRTLAGCLASSAKQRACAARALPTEKFREPQCAVELPNGQSYLAPMPDDPKVIPMNPSSVN